MKKADIAVVGGGASGLIAAYTAAKILNEKSGGKVVLIEGNTGLGKKLLATGNGRCNFTNMAVKKENYHGDTTEIEKVLTVFTAKDAIETFSEIGLLSRIDGEGRVYPANLQAAAVLKRLCAVCEREGVEIHVSAAVKTLEKNGDRFFLETETEKFSAKKVILACGGKASPKHSCEKNGYVLAKKFGHSVTALSPALVQIYCKACFLKQLKGMRCKACVKLFCKDEELYAESGEIIFSEKGLSGICIFNISSFLSENVRKTSLENYRIEVDLAESLGESEIVSHLIKLQNNMPNMPYMDMLSGMINIRVGETIIRELFSKKQGTIADLEKREMLKIARAVKRMVFEIEGLGTWEQAQVTAGGIPLGEVRLPEMKSKLVQGIYLTGEMLNVNGDCGGFNLHFAWATGKLAGENAACNL